MRRIQAEIPLSLLSRFSRPPLKKLVLVIQDKLLAYMTREFKFDHLKNPAALGDSVHLHAYRMAEANGRGLRLNMASRLSTDTDGIGMCLGLQAEARVELAEIISALQAKISPNTRFQPV